MKDEAWVLVSSSALILATLRVSRGKLFVRREDGGFGRRLPHQQRLQQSALVHVRQVPQGVRIDARLSGCRAEHCLKLAERGTFVSKRRRRIAPLRSNVRWRSNARSTASAGWSAKRLAIVLLVRKSVSMVCAEILEEIDPKTMDLPHSTPDAGGDGASPVLAKRESRLTGAGGSAGGGAPDASDSAVTPRTQARMLRRHALPRHLRQRGWRRHGRWYKRQSLRHARQSSEHRQEAGTPSCCRTEPIRSADRRSRFPMVST